MADFVRIPANPRFGPLAEFYILFQWLEQRIKNGAFQNQNAPSRYHEACKVRIVRVFNRQIVFVSNISGRLL
ncbi:hypothetical protein GCM10007972_20060 [Iodidimonas muriae]|uniref:Uncharacterized protein n=1 Tax=Iodidimonas muriae TaxID=261467 RepID=A0ABQ2LFC5_9PROT|nr:hypothetical protein GCM10007972_20060 [Iodidimonas muriae]